jgi:hypothetical protein
MELFNKELLPSQKRGSKISWHCPFNKEVSHLDWFFSSPDSNLASCDECCVYRALIVGYRGILSANSLTLIPYCSLSLSAGIGAQETLSSGVPILSHWKISIGCCDEGSLLLVQCHLISINRFWNLGRSKVSLNEKLFYEAKWKLWKFTGVEGLIRKIKKPVAVLSQGLN